MEKKRKERRRELFCSNFRASCAEKFEAKEKGGERERERREKEGKERGKGRGKGGKRKGERGKSVSARRSFPRAERHN